MPIKADCGCSIDWMVKWQINRLGGLGVLVNWVVCHVSVDCRLQWTDSPVVSVYKHIYHLEPTLGQNEIKKVCLLSAQNEIILSFRIVRCKMKQRIHVISFCVDLDNAK